MLYIIAEKICKNIQYKYLKMKILGIISIFLSSSKKGHPTKICTQNLHDLMSLFNNYNYLGNGRKSNKIQLKS